MTVKSDETGAGAAASGETAARSGAEWPVPGAEMPLESRGASGSDSATPGVNTGQINAGNDGQAKETATPKAFGFTAALATPFVPLKLGFPALWPDTAVRPLFFKLDFLLSGDADREQSTFLKMTEDEQAAETYRYDCRMLALLSCLPPEGLLDFDAAPFENMNPDDAEDRKALAAAVFAYLYRPGTTQEKAFAFIARQFMSRYWSRVMPRDYL